MKLETYIISKSQTDKYYHKHFDDEVTISITNVLGLVKESKCTCKSCSLVPEGLCIRKLFALQAVAKEFVRLSLDKKKEEEEYE